MEYGLQLANLDFQKLRDRAQAAEGQGYTVITVPDHIVMEGPEKSFDPAQPLVRPDDRWSR